MNTDYDLAEADILFDAFEIALTEVGGDIDVVLGDATNLIRSLIITSGASRRREAKRLSSADTSMIAGSAVSLYRLLRHRQLN